MTSNASKARVCVEDDGQGMSLRQRKGLGLFLVEALAQQIQARVDYLKAEKGSRTVLCFPVVTRF